VLNPDEEKELDIRFTYHPPKGDQPAKYEQLRSETKTLARTILELTPVSREQSLALTSLEQAVMWANASIARRSDAPKVD
jgi:hypothetical protein